MSDGRNENDTVILDCIGCDVIIMEVGQVIMKLGAFCIISF